MRLNGYTARSTRCALSGVLKSMLASVFPGDDSVTTAGVAVSFAGPPASGERHATSQ